MAAIRPNPTLSDDLISEILVRVPVKSLLRFQSVCKPWLSLFKDPAFIKSQLLCATKIDQFLTTSLFRLDEETHFSLLHVDSRQFVADLKLPFSRDEFEIMPECTLVGSANGIVCVAVYFADYRTSIYLWNPATRQSKVIPAFRCPTEALGFGYDERDQDSKVVRVVRLPSFCEVYSVNKDVWCMVPDDPIDTPLNEEFDVCVNGFLCTVGEYGMITFDLNKEVLNCAIKLPVIYVAAADVDDYDDIIESNDARIINFNKSIAVIIRWGGLNEDEKINMWTLDDEACFRGGGVEASWTLMFSIDLGVPTQIVHCCFSNGDLLMLTIIDNAYKWISCHVNKKAAKIVPLSTDMAKHLYDDHIYKYTESLVSLAGFKQVNWDAGNDDD